MMCAKAFTKGAAEIVLSMCDNQLLPDGSVAPMQEEDKQRLLASFGRDGRRCVLSAQLFIHWYRIANHACLCHAKQVSPVLPLSFHL